VAETALRIVRQGDKLGTVTTLARAPAWFYVGRMELHSPQCIVRSYRVTDAPSLTRHGNNRKVWLNLRDRFPHPFEEQGCVEYITRGLQSPVEASFAIDVGGAAIGGISLHLGTDIERVGAEMGYWIGEEFWGRGIASAAIKLVTAHAFTDLGLLRVFAVPFTTNAASCRALEKAGYQREGTLRRSAIKDGRVLDQHLYAAVRD
jgi:[ribosomal protein S5]-alanine N-acetyltransferase